MLRRFLHREGRGAIRSHHLLALAVIIHLAGDGVRARSETGGVNRSGCSVGETFPPVLSNAYVSLRFGLKFVGVSVTFTGSPAITSEGSLRSRLRLPEEAFHCRRR